MWKQTIVTIMILSLAVGAAYYLWPEEAAICQICRRPMHAATTYLVTLEGGQTVELCCPRCGLHFQQGRSDVVSAEVTDYESRGLINASDAFYVVASSVHPCCSEARILKDRAGVEYERTWDRCLPSVIGFSSRDKAESFQSQYGGEMASHQDLEGQNSP